MKQIAPNPEPLIELVSKLTYKPGWSFELLDLDRGQGSEGLTLVIRVTGLNSYNPEERFTVIHYMIVPAASYNERSWRRWLLDQILLVERHEACEWFQIDGKHVYGPNHSPGNDPYIVFDWSTEQESQLNYKGER